MEDVVEKVVTTASRRLADELTLDELARIAMFSKFHFSRMFRKVTGISPGRFLSAMRLHEAKRLLVTTSLSVADISYQVGYTSVGSFTSRFTASVGVPPTEFRRLGGYAPLIPEAGCASSARGATLMGRIQPPAGDFQGPTFVGVFPTPVPEGQPVQCTVLDRPGRWSFTDLSAGRWYVLAVSVASTAGAPVPRLAGELPTMVGRAGPIDVPARATTVHSQVRLEPMRPTDPPVLLALLDIP